MQGALQIEAKACGGRHCTPSEPPHGERLLRAARVIRFKIPSLLGVLYGQVVSEMDRENSAAHFLKVDDPM